MKTQKKSILYNKKSKMEEQAAWIFVAPFMIGLIFLKVIPVIYSLVMSFVDANSIKSIGSMNFVGFRNYYDVFKDSITMNSFLNSLIYTSIYVPGTICVALILASALNIKLYLRGFVRTMILVPYVSNVVAIGIIWSIIFNPFNGPLNIFLKGIGVQNPPMWLVGSSTSLITISLIAIWQNVAFQTIVYLAAMQDVPRELYESASLDGAGKIKKFIHITLPMISPTTFFLVISSIIGSTQNFALVKVLTNGGPGTSSNVVALNIYETAFGFNKFSNAAAQSVILFIILMIFTFIQWKGQKKWVHY